MPIISGAVTKSTSPTVWSSADGFAYTGAGLHPLADYFTPQAYAYEAVFERQLWAQVAIIKLLSLQILLPMKVYQRDPEAGRLDARQSPFGQLIAQPSPTIDPVQFWSWFILQRHIHGKAYAMKVRDAGGRPVQLQLIHPTRIRYGPARGEQAGPEGQGSRWWYVTDPRNLTERPLERWEFIAWRRPHPKHPEQAMSPLEQLRDTLELEGAARVANKALYSRGGRHSIILKTPKNFGSAPSLVLKRLSEQYQERHGGVENWGKPLILEDGMEPVQLDHSPEDLQYVEARRLNREEIAAAFDIPPPAIGILDRATFSNVTEQNRMLYRTTMPPLLQSFESMINFDLRDGRHGRPAPPDFGEAFYFEHLVDGVLRGSTEERIAANAQAIQTGQLTPAEAREMENRPRVEGSDRLFINTAMAPLTEAGPDPEALAGLVQKLYLGTPSKVVLTTDEARQIISLAGGELGPAPELASVPAPPAARRLDPAVISTVMGRLSRPKALAELDPVRLVDGLDERSAAVVGQAVEHVAELDGTVAGLRRLIKTLGAEQL